MPLYDYRCVPCKVQTEMYQSSSDDKPDCPGCAIPMERMVSAPAITRGPTTKTPLAKPITYIDEAKGKMYRIGTNKKWDD